MQKTFLLGVAVLMSMHASAEAQCNRGSRGGSPSASFSPSLATNSIGSPLESFSAGPNAALAAQAQLALYQFALAQQQRNLQLMAQRQRVLQQQLLASRNADRASKLDQVANRDVSRKERLRQQNAGKAFQLAMRAEMNGRESKAKSNYRRVIRIVGEKDDLGRRANDALAALTEDLSKGNTLLASVVRDR